MPIKHEAQKKLDEIQKILAQISELEKKLEILLGMQGEDEEIEDVPEKEFHKTKIRLCKNCGKPGHRRDSCTEESNYYKKPPDEELELSPEKLTRSQFESVIESKEHDMTSKEISEAMEVSISQVNKAMQASSFEKYLKMS